MTSNLKTETNRSNSKKSTGPRSSESKARAALNSLKHGLTARTVLMPGEDKAAYDSFRNDIFADLKPGGPVETALADCIAANLWRLKRVPFLEAQLLAYAENGAVYRNRKGWSYCGDGPNPAEATLWGAAWYFYDEHICKLKRYETALDRSVRQSLAELRKMQKERRNSSNTSPAERVDRKSKSPNRLPPDLASFRKNTCGPDGTADIAGSSKPSPLLQQPVGEGSEAPEPTSPSAATTGCRARGPAGTGPVAQLASFGKQVESADGTADQSVSTDMKASPSQPATEGRVAREASLLARETSLLAPEVAPESTATVGTGPVAQPSDFRVQALGPAKEW